MNRSKLMPTRSCRSMVLQSHLARSAAQIFVVMFVVMGREKISVEQPGALARRRRRSRSAPRRLRFFRIDILVDLNGFAIHARTGIFIIWRAGAAPRAWRREHATVREHGASEPSGSILKLVRGNAFQRNVAKMIQNDAELSSPCSHVLFSDFSTGSR